MHQNIDQNNVFGNNLINSTIRKTITNHGVGFIAGIASTIIAEIIVWLITN